MRTMSSSGRHSSPSPARTAQLTGARRHPVARWTALLAAVLVAGGALAACGSPAGPSATSSTPTTSHSEASVDGNEVDRLPTVPGPTTKPGTPDLSTVTGQKTFLQSVFTDIQSVWKEDVTTAGLTYAPARLVLFQSQVSTACGTEKADVGPFYCSGDKTVYLDIRFFSAMDAQFGVSGDFAEAYVVAHELGHHIQNLLGITARVATADRADPSQANALSVRVELQADCFAGVWAHSTYTRALLEPGDIDEALHAAQVVGDDFLAQASGASVVDPDSWTHGSSSQRQHWFTTGYEVGRPSACDTFAS
jgi:uncharacterized protein